MALNLPCCCQQRRVRQHSATRIPPSVTISKGFATNENTKRPTIVIYPTVSPETVIIPIVSCIIGFPILALLVICCLRRRAKLARDRDRRRNIDLQDHANSFNSLMTGASNISDIPNAIRNEMTALPKKAVICR
uniref:Uncharacterized protein n=1 Tax=Anopheles coluzzii TaxID=1518534 RepID=A0A8W7PV79_ANOCL